MRALLSRLACLGVASAFGLAIWLADPPATPPSAPFSTPPPARSVDPPAPVVSGLTDASGRALYGPLAEGDSLWITGAHLPVEGTARLGPTPLRIHADSRPDRLRVRIGVVPAEGVHCLALTAGEPTAGRALGRGFGGDRARRPDLCLALRASTLAAQRVARADPAGGIFLPLPPEAFAADRPLAISVNQIDRGGRTLTVRLSVDPMRDPAQPHRAWLDHVAARLNDAIGAGCGSRVVADTGRFGVVLTPCEGARRAPERPPSQATRRALHPSRPIHGDAAAWSRSPEPGCQAASPRARAWCHFAELVRPQQRVVDPWREADMLLGLPVWEGYRPLAALHGAAWALDPRDRPVAQKAVLLEPALLDALREGRAVAPGRRIVETVFVGADDLPAGDRPGAWYSYVPPGKSPRRYLRAMRISVRTPSGVERAVFRVERADADVGAEQPAELRGTVWGRFSLCLADDADGPCGAWAGEGDGAAALLGRD